MDTKLMAKRKSVFWPRRWILLLTLLGGGAASWAQQPVPPQTTPNPVAKPMAHKHKTELAVGVATAPDGALWLVGLNSAGRLFVQSAPLQHGTAERQWSQPRVLESADTAISADGENHPKLIFGPAGSAIITYTQPLAKPYSGNIRAMRSTDSGRTFSAPVTVHADRQIITHRFESMAFDGRGALHVVWIDKRDLEVAPKIGGKSSYRGAAIFRNVSLDGGATFGPDIKLADHSCECCRIALGLGRDGLLRAMWRHVFEPSIRDHAFAVLDDKTETPIVRATFDEWHLEGCPHHGPALAASADGFHAVWFGIRQEAGESVAAVRYARLNADGSPQLDTVVRLPDARAEHADIMALGERVVVVWRSTDGMQTTLKAWLSNDGGRSFTIKELEQVSVDNDFPRLVQQGTHIAAVWRNANEVKVYDIDF
jgi:hypothetical protein